MEDTAVETWTLEMAVIDWIAIALLLGGLFMGFNKGLGKVFAILLWLVAAMWLGKSLAPRIIEWMPNSGGDAPDGGQFAAYGSIAAVVLGLPLVAKLLGGPLGKKKTGDAEVYNNYMGSLVGLVNATLFFTLVVPYAYRLEFVSSSYPTARSPAVASIVADNVSFLYPPVFRDELEETIGSVGEEEVLEK